MRNLSIQSRSYRCQLLAGIAALAVTTPAFAQDAAEDQSGNAIVVTASKREQAARRPVLYQCPDGC